MSGIIVARYYPGMSLWPTRKTEMKELCRKNAGMRESQLVSSSATE